MIINRGFNDIKFIISDGADKYLCIAPKNRLKPPKFEQL